MIETQINTKEKEEWGYLEFLWGLEKNWKEDLRQTYPKTDKELVKIFKPEPKMLQEKIGEWESVRDILVKKIKNKLLAIREQGGDDLSKWFWKKWLAVCEGKELSEIDARLKKLKWQLITVKGRILQVKNGVTREQVDQALQTPIENVINEKFKKSGNRLVGLCPLHKEKTPSFTVYPETNTFYCYGCGEGGNVINLIIKLHGLGFIEAVRWLNGE